MSWKQFKKTKTYKIGFLVMVVAGLISVMYPFHANKFI